MRRFIVVRGEFEGTHHWPDAPAAVSFLRNLHRHVFKVSVRIEVTHPDRDIEFFMARWHLREAMTKVQGELTRTPSLSCEMLAERIGVDLKMLHYDVKEVVVSEDGQHDGIVVWE